MHTLPHPENPFKEQSELAIAWELGWMKRNENISQERANSAEWSVNFRQQVRGALFDYYPNNPCSLDGELIEAIKDLVVHWKGAKGNIKEV